MAISPASPSESLDRTGALRAAESALRRLGYARVPPRPDAAPAGAHFWVQEPGTPRRIWPVYVEERASPTRMAEIGGRSAILVVEDEGRARDAWQRLRSDGPGSTASDVAILVLRAPSRSAPAPYWHTGPVARSELLTLATGVIVGLFRRAASSGEGAQVDFEEMLAVLKKRFHVDVEGTLGVTAPEDVLWIMYQLALRSSYAPGDPSANLHLLVLKPTGPSARLPWFAA